MQIESQNPKSFIAKTKKEQQKIIENMKSYQRYKQNLSILESTCANQVCSDRDYSQLETKVRQSEETFLKEMGRENFLAHQSN